MTVSLSLPSRGGKQVRRAGLHSEHRRSSRVSRLRRESACGHCDCDGWYSLHSRCWTVAAEAYSPSGSGGPIVWPRVWLSRVENPWQAAPPWRRGRGTSRRLPSAAFCSIEWPSQSEGPNCRGLVSDQQHLVDYILHFTLYFFLTVNLLNFIAV